MRRFDHSVAISFSKSREFWIDVINLRSPRETLKIIGLLLRNRGGYVFEPMPNYFLELDRRAIYKEFLHHKLPHISRYIKACASAEGLGAIGLTYLAESTVVRCMRVLHARDEIGVLFTCPSLTNAVMRSCTILTI